MDENLGGNQNKPGEGGPSSEVGSANKGAPNPMGSIINAATSKIPGGDGGKNPLTSALKSAESGGGNGNPATNPAEAVAKKALGKHGAEAIELGKAAVDDARLLAGDATVAKKMALEFAKDPVGFVKKHGKVIGGAIGIALSIIIIVTVFPLLAMYKIVLMVKDGEVVDVATELNVNATMLTGLAQSFALAAQDQPTGGEKGTVYAQAKPPLINESDLNPDVQSLIDEWQNAGIMKKFREDYGGKLVYTGGGSGGAPVFDAADWDLYVQDKRIGPASGDSAQAYIRRFTRNTTQWDKAYQRKSIQGVAETQFQYTKKKLKLEDSGKSLDKSRTNVTKELVKDTLAPISANSDKYYKCLTIGEANCDSLGLGDTGSPSNGKTKDTPGWLESVFGIRSGAGRKLADVDTAKLNAFAQKQAESAGESIKKSSDKRTLIAKISTGASDAMLDSLPNQEDGTAPDTDVLLEMYDRYQTALENGNFAKVSYDRTAKQNVAQAMNYNIASGQFLNHEMSLLDMWSLTENVGNVEDSPIFRAAYMGTPLSAFAQSGNELYSSGCQSVFNDEKPVNEANSQNTDRSLKRAACFKKSFVPSTPTYQSEADLDAVYSALRDKNAEVDNPKTGLAALAEAIKQRKSTSNNSSKKQKGEIRNSPLATDSVDIDPSLSPDFDAYTNKVYGTSLTGGEVDGDAFDVIYGANQVLRATAQVDETYGVGAAYMTNAEVAESARYAAKLDNLELAFTPLSERLFALQSPDSLVGRLALFAPTSPRSAVAKVASLLEPGNLTRAFSSRLEPSSYASNVYALSANPMGIIPTGIPINDPSVKRVDKKFYDDNNCATGGAAVTKEKQEGSPYPVASVVRPCKLSKTVATIGACAINTKPCDLDEAGGGSAPSGEPPQGTVDESQTAMTKGCGGIRVHTSIVDALERLCAKPGANILTGSGWRDNKTQIQLRIDHGCPGALIMDRNCKGNPLTAVPGRSQHEKGLAIDFRNCSYRSTPCFKWLSANAASEGFFNLPQEPWHWSTTGT